MKADPQKTAVEAQWKHDSPLLCCRFDPTGAHVYASSYDYAVHRWQVADGKKTSFPVAHDSWVGALAVTPDGGTLITGGYDGRLIWWPATADKPQPLRSVEAHRGWVRAMSLSPDGKRLFTGGNDQLVKLWNVADGSLLREFKGHQSQVYSLLVHPGGKWLLTGDLKGEVRQWDVETGQTIATFDAKALYKYETSQQVDYGGVRSISLSADGKHLAAGGLTNGSNPLGGVNDPTALLFQWSDRKKLRTFAAPGVQGVLWRVLFHPESFLIGLSSGTGMASLFFWKQDADKDFFRFTLPSFAHDMDLHPDGLRLAVAHYDKHLRIYRLAAKA